MAGVIYVNPETFVIHFLKHGLLFGEGKHSLQGKRMIVKYLIVKIRPIERRRFHSGVAHVVASPDHLITNGAPLLPAIL